VMDGDCGEGDEEVSEKDGMGSVLLFRDTKEDARLCQTMQMIGAGKCPCPN